MATREWGWLPREILGIILNKLDITGFYSFKDVCQHWSSSLQQDANLGLLHPLPSPPWLIIAGDPEKKPGFFSPTNNIVYNFNFDTVSSWQPAAPEERLCIGSSYGLLAFIDGDYVINIINPFKPEHGAITLPPIQTLYPNDEQWWNKMQSVYMHLKLIAKLVLCPTVSGEYTVMIIHDSHQQLAFCKSDDDSWTALPSYHNLDHSYHDIYYSSSDSYFYAFTFNGMFVVWDLRDTNSPKLIRACQFGLPWNRSWTKKEHTRKMFLAQLGGDVYIAVHHATEVFNVYKLDWVKKTLKKVESLGNDGDGVFFLGINNAMSFSAGEFPGLKSNSIYFVVPGSYCNVDLGVFSLEDRDILPCYFYRINPVFHMHVYGDRREILRQPVWISPNPW